MGMYVFESEDFIVDFLELQVEEVGDLFLFLHVFILLAIFCLAHEGDNGVLIQPVILSAHELNVGCRVSVNRQVMVLKLAEDIFDSPLIFIDEFVDLFSEILVEESCFFYVGVHD